MTDTTPFDCTRVPRTFVHCFNNSCPRSAECLRHLAAENIPAEVRYVNIVNPRNIPAEGECPHFMPIIKVRIAWGVKELFDHIPHKEAVAMRKEVIAHFGKTHYYRMQRKEYSIKPDEQEYLRRVSGNTTWKKNRPSSTIPTTINGSENGCLYPLSPIDSPLQRVSGKFHRMKPVVSYYETDGFPK